MLSLFAAAPLWCAMTSVHLYQHEAMLPQPASSPDYHVTTEGTPGGDAYTGGFDAQPLDDVTAQALDSIYVSIPGYGNASLLEANQVGTGAWHALQDLGIPLGDFDLVEIHGRFTNSDNPGILLLMPPTRCLGDFNHDGQTTVADALPFIQAYVAGHPSADLTNNGRIDVYDQMIFFQLVSFPHCVPAW